MVRYGRPYAGLIGDDDGVVDMSWNIIEEQSFLFNTTIDRLWLDLHYDKFQITLGRQRINWGQTFVWNPNDIFNAYSYFDFDYVERPGSDAIRFQYFPSSSSVAEVALKVDDENDITAAGLWRFNLWNYDIQFLAGLMNSEDVVIGAGWSGSHWKHVHSGVKAPGSILMKISREMKAPLLLLQVLTKSLRIIQ